MDHKFYISIFVIFLIGSSFCDELLFAYIFSSPGASYPKQELFDWAKGKSMHLSPAGARQHYILGRELRQRYVTLNKLLDDKYNLNQVYMQALMINRATASAYAQFMGLYLPGSGPVISSESVREKALPPNQFDYQLWQADLGSGALNYTHQTFPLNVIGGIPDTLLNPEEVCAHIKNMVQDKYGDSSWRSHQSAIAQLTQTLHVDPLTVNNISYPSELRDLVYSTLYQGQLIIGEQETWTLLSATIAMDQCAWYDYFLNVESGNSVVSKLLASPVLLDVNKKLETAVFNHLNKTTKNDELKFVSLIGTEKQLAALLLNLDINAEKYIVPPASSLIFEVYKDPNGETNTPADYYVKYYYNAEKNGSIPFPEFQQLVAKNCYSEINFKDLCLSNNNGGDSIFTICFNVLL